MKQIKKMKKTMGCVVVGIVTIAAGSAWGAEAATNEVQAVSTNTTAAAAPVAAVPAKDAFMSAGSKMLSLSYGYVMTDYEDIDNSVEGWRISGTYEMNPSGGPLVHGLTIGYMETSAERTGAQVTEYEVKSLPVYYAPKIILGKKALKVFAKGALGCHFSDYSASKSATGVSSSADEFGFYGGASLGGMLVLKEKFFVNLEYEWAYMSNSYFEDGVVSTAMVGIGMKL